MANTMAVVDPSQNVHGDLLPHIHLISTFRYATMPRVELQEVTKWLLQAPKIARDTSPFYWTYLDCPADGSILLTWQPTARRGTEFATDGYIWAGPEVQFQQNMGNGLLLEIYFQRAGYRMGEQYAVHSRRRFRLLLAPGQAPNPNLQVDPNLWIVHYGPAEKNDRLPVSAIVLPPPIHQLLNFRQHLLSMGQIIRKEFMLSDRVNWPQIPFPTRATSMYAPPIPQRHIPQAMAYPPHPGQPIAPAPKRRGGQSSSSSSAAAAAAAAAAQAAQMAGAAAGYHPDVFNDEEDVSAGDMFDHLTPRELSLARYQQNHEWMEEILLSPYQIGQIEVSDLGLGKKGELAALTEGIFEAQGFDALQRGPKKPYTGKLDPGLADEFRKRVEERNAAVKAEIEEMKAKHEKMMAKFKRSAVIKQAEQELRFAVQETGTEFWRLEGKIDEGEEAPSQKIITKSLDEIVARVEELVGKHATVVKDVHRIQDGGYQEPQPEPPAPTAAPSAGAVGDMSCQASHAGSNGSGVLIGSDHDIDMGGTAGSLLDQMHSSAGFSSTSTPMNNFPTPQAHLPVSSIPSSAATPGVVSVSSPNPVPPTAGVPAAQVQQQQDVQMGGTEPAAVVPAKEATTATEQGISSGEGDWVVVGKEGIPPAPGPSNITQPPAAPATAPLATTPAATGPGGAPTPGSTALIETDFADLDTAGDALASYEAAAAGSGSQNGDDHEGGRLEDEEDMDMMVGGEESAFGEAFEGVEAANAAVGQGGVEGGGDVS